MGKQYEEYNSSDWVKVLVRLPREIRTRVKTIAARRERSMNEQILDYIINGLNEENISELLEGSDVVKG